MHKAPVVKRGGRVGRKQAKGRGRRVDVMVDGVTSD